MATLTHDALASHLLRLSPDEPVPAFGDDALVNPVGVYRCYLAETFARLLDCDSSKTQEAIQWVNVLTKGDLALVVARLRIKGANPAQLAADLAAKVC
jgi:arginyl-tRNA synthetase